MKKLLSKTVKGFTLIELMIVVAIIGILAAIAIPKFADLITKSREAGVKGNLGTVRSGVSIYYSDTEGLYPATGANFVVSMTAGGKYLQELPDIKIPKQNTSANKNIGHNAQGINATPSALADRTTNDSGNWYYDSLTGNFGVECTHEDTKSLRWSTY